MSRQLLSELMNGRHQKQNQKLNKSAIESYSQQNNPQINERLHINVQQNSVQKQIDTEAVDAQNIKKFVNQSNKYWQQEREMLTSNKKLSQSFQSENIDCNSSGYFSNNNNTNNQINNFNNEIKIAIQDCKVDVSIKQNQKNTNMDVASEIIGQNGSFHNSFNQNSFHDFQLNASQQEYMKASNKHKKNSQTNNDSMNSNKIHSQNINLENILINIDKDEQQCKQQSEINQQQILNKSQNEIRKKTETLHQQLQQISSQQYSQNNLPHHNLENGLQRRSISIGSGVPTNTQKQGKNQIFSQNNIYPASQVNINQTQAQQRVNQNSQTSQLQQVDQSDNGSTSTFAIRDKSDHFSEERSPQQSGLNNSFYLGEDGINKKSINHFQDKYKQVISMNTHMKNIDIQFVFSYTRKQATCFPKEIKINENYLEVLELSHNRFKTFPEEIQYFKKLKRLKLDNNFLRQIPQWLFKILNLQEFSISNNLIQELPINIGLQQNLITLDLSQNRISHIPEQMTKIKTLQYLNINNNEFTQLPLSFRNIIDGSLKELNFDWFKYCNPPLPAQQINTDNKLNNNQNKTNMNNQTAIHNTSGQNNHNVNNQNCNNSNNNQIQNNIINNYHINQSQYNNKEISINSQKINNTRGNSPSSTSENTFQNFNVQLNYRNYAGQDTISPLKKFSQLLFRADQQQSINDHKLQYRNGQNSYSQMLGNNIGFYTFKQFVTEMSSNGFLLNIRNFKGQTLMHQASANEDIGVIEALNLIDPQLKNECDQNQHSPLSLSINEEKYFSAKKLLQLGADANLGGSIYGSPLNIATIKGQIYLIQDIIQKHVNTNISDVDGNTCMHYIMTIFSRDTLNSTRIASLLLDNGGDPNLKNNDGWTPLHLAVRRSQYAAINFAIDHNNSWQVKQLQKDNVKEKQYENCRHVPINYCKPPFKVGQSSVAEKTHKFDFTIKGGLDKWSCLHISCYNNDLKMTKTLLELKETDFFALNKKNQTPLFLSSKGNILNKLMRLYLKQRITNDLQIQLNLFNNKSDLNFDTFQNQLNTNSASPKNNKDILRNSSDKAGTILTESSLVSECQKEIQIQIMNNTFTRNASQGNSQIQNKSTKQAPTYKQNDQNHHQKLTKIDSHILPEFTNVNKILTNITSPQEKTLPFHLQKKYVHLKIQSKKATSQELINSDEDEENEDIGEFTGQHCDDFNMKDIDENNQIKEIRQSREGNLINNSKRPPNSYRSTNNSSNYNTDYNNSPLQNKKNVSQAQQNNFSIQIQNNFGVSTQQKHPLPPYSSVVINKKPTSSIQKSFDQFSSKICKVQQKHFIDEEDSEIQNPQQNQQQLKGFSTQRETSNNYNNMNVFKEQKGRIFNSDTKPIQNNTQRNSHIQRNNQNSLTFQNNSEYTFQEQISNQIQIKQDNVSLKQIQNSFKDQKKLCNNLLKYSHDDKEGNMFCIPKLQSGDNRQAIIFQTIQNIFSLYVSGTIQYKKSLIETIQCLADKYKQIFIILKLYIESYSRMDTFLQDNANYLPKHNNLSTSLSLRHIKGHTLLLFQDLLSSINTIPVNYRTLMRFVEDNNEEFQENLLLLRQNQDKNTNNSQTPRSNSQIPIPQGDTANDSQSLQIQQNTQKSNQQPQSFSSQVYLNSQQSYQKQSTEMTSNTANKNSPQSKSAFQSKDNSQSKLQLAGKNSPQRKDISINNISPQIKYGSQRKSSSYSNSPQNNQKESDKDSIIEGTQRDKIELQEFLDCKKNENILIQEYLLSSLIKIDLTPDLDLQLLNKFQKEDQSILLQFEAFQTSCYITSQTNKPNLTQINNTLQVFSTQQNNFTTEKSSTQIEQDLSELPKQNYNIFQNPIPVKRNRITNNTVFTYTDRNTSSNKQTGLRYQAASASEQNNTSAPDIYNQNNSTVGSTLNTSNTGKTQIKSVSNNTINSSQNTYQSNKQNFTNSSIQNINDNLQKQNIPNQNIDKSIFSYPQSNINYNGYLNSQVIQQSQQGKQDIFQKPLQRIDVTNKPTIQSAQINQIVSESQNIHQNIHQMNNKNNLSLQITNTFIKQKNIEQTISSESFNLNENLENSFLNDEAVIANKYLNTQINKFQKYK